MVTVRLTVVLVVPLSGRQTLASGPELCPLDAVLEPSPSLFHTVDLLDKRMGNCIYTVDSNQWSVKALYNIA